MKKFQEWIDDQVGKKEEMMAKRDELINMLRQAFPGEFIKPGEDFSASQTRAIWITGKKMADYYGKDNSGFGYFVNKRLQSMLERSGFYLEPYDAETWFAYPIN